uniref:Uncharacterized protein n=1 Tax=Tanacetum cinerariifolium TaxID=118510 RepID=A0A699HD58_TANCI|nr:hypothetical protein [Tanacetum cinerariifolium]
MLYSTAYRSLGVLYRDRVKQVQESIIDEEVRESGIKSLGDVPLDEFGRADANESPFDTESKIKFIGKEVPKFIYNGSQFNEDATQGTGFFISDQVIQEGDFDLESMPGDKIESLPGFEELESDDDTITLNLPCLKIADKIKESISSMVIDALKERLHKMLSNTLNTILRDLLKDLVKNVLPKFDKRVQKTLKANVPERILKLLNKELIALNILENNRIVDLQKKLTKAVKIKVGKYVQRNVKREVKVFRELVKYCVMRFNKNDVNVCDLVDLIRDLVVLIDTASASAKAAPEGERMSTQETKMKRL